jgi:hypothetical protein
MRLVAWSETRRVIALAVERFGAGAAAGGEDVIGVDRPAL